MEAKEKVIVLGRNYTSRLGMIRAAGLAGYEVIVINTERGEKAKNHVYDQHSKYVADYHYAAEPHEEELLSALLGKCAADSVKNILLPTDDYTAAVIDKHQRELAEKFLFPHAGHEPGAIVGFMNKEVQKEYAQRAGLNVPKGWTARFSDGSFEVPEDIPFPCFVKAEISFQGSKFYMKKCATKEELEAHLGTVAKDLLKKKKQTDLLIEEFYEIEREFAILGFSDGERVLVPDVLEANFMHLGVTAQGTIMSIDMFPGLRSQLERYVAEYHFCGLFDIDLFESKGKIYFCEMNFRFGASGYAVTHAGVNLPELLIDTLLGKEVDFSKVPEVPKKTFANEKVCCQEYVDKTMDWKATVNSIREVDFTFVENAEDPGPGKAFWKWARNYRMKRLIKGLLPGKG
ncbi:MAG: ATP-grasp domain-containing protein [Lachnospiraceae bacterium]|nr:ATP-grasp domain-containing protein [Lachnospiraceae bacterium]